MPARHWLVSSCLATAVLAGCASQQQNDISQEVEASTPEVKEVEAKVAPVEDGGKPVPERAQAKAQEQSDTVKAAKAEPKSESKVVAKTEPAEPKVTQSDDSAKKAAKQGEQAADAMMASLAAKDKFAVIKETPAKTPAPQAKAAPKAKVEVKSEKITKKKVAAKIKKSALVKKALDVSMKDLPVTVELWTIGNSPSDNSLQLTTPTWQMGEGSYLSQVWVTLKDDGLHINSSSDIDPKAKGSGIVLNGGQLIPFSRIDGHKVAVLDGEWMDELSNGGSMEIFMGFFPDKVPSSPTFKSDASLDALSRLVPTYEKLSK